MTITRTTASLGMIAISAPAAATLALQEQPQAFVALLLANIGAYAILVFLSFLDTVHAGELRPSIAPYIHGACMLTAAGATFGILHVTHGLSPAYIGALLTLPASIAYALVLSSAPTRTR